MTSGVVYYNVGRSCAVRLLVSAHSLVKHYTGNITILSDGNESHSYCKQIASALNINYKEVLLDMDRDQHNYPYLVKTRINEIAPYDYNVFIDADTLIVGSISELFNSSPFTITRMCEWSTQKRTIANRISSWSHLKPELVDKAIKYGKAINTGVYSFDRNASIFNEWYDLTLANKQSFIPDEVACQLLITVHEHKLLDCRFNYSCKYGPNIDDIRIIHFHGRKHCRPGLPYNGIKWVTAYNEVVKLNLANIKTWQPAGDKMLYKYLKSNE